MIDIRKLKELVRLMVANELTEIDLRDSEEQVTLRRGGAGVPLAAPVATVAVAFLPARRHWGPLSREELPSSYGLCGRWTHWRILEARRQLGLR